MTTKITKEELPPSIYNQYKNLAVQAYATDTSFTVVFTVGATVHKHRWVRKDKKWTKRAC